MRFPHLSTLLLWLACVGILAGFAACAPDAFVPTGLGTPIPTYTPWPGATPSPTPTPEILRTA